VGSLGRPRDPDVDGAALAAAARLMVDDGYATMTMERIAERAGVSKAALYRRWPNKLALVVDAIDAFTRDSIVVPDTGSLRGDMISLLGGFSRDRHADVETYDALTAAVESDHELAERCRAVLAAKLSNLFRVLVERAVSRGELPAGTDVELVADLAPALIRFRRQTTGRPADAAFIERIADQFFSSGAARHL
jgi:AcrR family transcriptional regulator